MVKAFAGLFAERGPPAELLLDNGSSFWSEELERLCRRWGVRLWFRAVNRPNCNWIVERNHRTIKRMAARTGGSIRDMLLWYNFTPKDGLKVESAPSHSLFTNKWRYPRQPVQEEQRLERAEESNFRVGETVYVKPAKARCTTRWQVRKVNPLLPSVRMMDLVK